MFYQSLTHWMPLSKGILVRGLFFAFAFFIVSLAAQQTSAATFTVTGTADSGAGSLRQAVADANGTPAADTINFNIPSTDSNCDSSGVCTITLTGGVITVQAAGGALIIANQTGASKLLISGNSMNRVFEGGMGANLTLDGLTITRGYASFTGGSPVGVVSNLRGTLTIMNSVFTRNGNLFIIATEASGPSGTLNVINTTVNNNTGFGIFFTNLATSGGTANIINSTISNNYPTGSSGDDAGGIHFLGDHLRITNSTISNNLGFQGGGIRAVTMGNGSPGSTSFVITNSTITDNTSVSGGGGIEVFRATLNLRNTIVSGNRIFGGVSDIRFWNSAGVSFGNNLIGTATTLEFGNAQWLPSDKLNQNAQLAPLANNGGATQTHALLPNSPAINAGNDCVLTANGCGDNNPAVPTDQRGAARAGTVDIGAFEFVAMRAAFDFDGDGKSDVSVFRPSNGFWYLNRSQSGFTAMQWGTSVDQIVPGDYDGDGKTDFAVFRKSADSTWYILNSADSTFRAARWGATNLEQQLLFFDLVAPGDYDGDGKTDLAVYRRTDAIGETGRYHILQSATGTQRVENWGSAFFELVAAADYDGDGKDDMAVRRGSLWYILRSQTGDSIAVPFGTITDKAVPADYDGDGKDDIAVFRPENGTWYIQQSRDGFVGFQFGISTDLPVAADYDGDGRTDIAVWRPSNGVWYLQQSTQGFTGIAFGISEDKPIPNAFIR